MIGQNIKILMPEPHRSQHDGYLERYRRTGETFILGKAREFEAVRKDGSVFPCEISVSRVDLPVASTAVLTGIIRDVSERKEAQRKLEELNRALEEKNRVLETIVFNAEKLASMGKLAASIAHEIRNPLTSLKVRLFSIRRAIGPNPVLEEKFRVVSEEIDRLEGVVRNF
ncbi:MAG: PAS domain S-box protein [Planctomycetota bacterium]